ncbi:MAG: hypothetical protein HY074_08950 [Deltaproteobacteria bacterium]|nr:hypothetical protein [Deltaproteobacteria bacterium]
MKLKRLIVGIIALTACSAGAAEDLLVTAKTPDGSISKAIYIRTDANGDLAGLRIGNSNFDARQIRKGVDLKVKGHAGILMLYANKVNLKSGGQLRLTYDTDKLNPFADTKELLIDIHRGDDGKWHLFEGGKTITTLAVQPAARGISSIKPVALLMNAPSNGANEKVVEEYAAKKVDAEADGPQAEATGKISTSEAI